jgi:hypothetical protein
LIGEAGEHKTLRLVAKYADAIGHDDDTIQETAGFRLTPSHDRPVRANKRGLLHRLARNFGRVTVSILETTVAQRASRPRLEASAPRS